MGVIDLNNRVAAIEKELEGGAGGEVIDQLEAAVTALEEAAIPIRTVVSELTNGTAYDDFGGVYYETLGNLVHVHVAVSGLTTNTSAVIFTVPEELAPVGSASTAVGVSQQYFGDSLTLCKGRVSASDRNVSVYSNGTYAIIEFYYMIGHETSEE